jgi:Flp pilus assembly protein TadG
MTRRTQAAMSRLWQDQRGGVAVEYLVVVVFMLGVASAVAGLSLAVVRSQQRAHAVLLSNTP